MSAQNCFSWFFLNAISLVFPSLKVVCRDFAMDEISCRGVAVKLFILTGMGATGDTLISIPSRALNK